VTHGEPPSYGLIHRSNGEKNAITAQPDNVVKWTRPMEIRPSPTVDIYDSLRYTDTSGLKKVTGSFSMKHSVKVEV